MTIINHAWDDSIAFLRRYAGLLVPLALATLFAADVVASLFAAPRAPGTISTGDFMTIVAKIWEIVGQLAITALVLTPGISVAESITLGGRRLGKVFLIGLLIFALAIVVCVPVVIWGYSNNIDMVAVLRDPRSMPTPLALYILAIAAGTIWLTARLLLINAIIVDRNPPFRAILGDAFALTRGIAAQLILALIIYAVIAAIVGQVVRFVGGSIFALIAGITQSPFLGAVLLAITSGVVSAALGLFATIFIAMVYKRRVAVS